MDSQTIDHRLFKQLAEAGAIKSATAVALGGNWSLLFKIGKTEKTLVSTNTRQIRTWRHLDSLVRYLLDIGIQQFDTDASHYETDNVRRRPDKVAVLKQAHEAAAHDKWFREQVTEAVKVADAHPDAGIPWDEAMAKLEERMIDKYGPRP